MAQHRRKRRRTNPELRLMENVALPIAGVALLLVGLGYLVTKGPLSPLVNFPAKSPAPEWIELLAKTLVTMSFILSSGLLVRSMHRVFSKRPGVRKRDAPRTGLFLLSLITPSVDRDVVLGHIEERYEKDLEKRGKLWASALMYSDVLRSIPPNAWCFVRRVARWIIVGTIVERVFFR